MLSDYHGGPLGIGEGIETAMGASALFDLPVWAAINATMLAKWSPPEGCTEVAIFGDNDRLFGGQGGAYALAHRLAVKGIAVTVHIPEAEGEDWNDVWIRRLRGKSAARQQLHGEPFWKHDADDRGRIPELGLPGRSSPKTSDP